MTGQARILATALACLGLLTGQHLTVWSSCQALSHGQHGAAATAHHANGESGSQSEPDQDGPHECDCPVAACCSPVAIGATSTLSILTALVRFVGDQEPQLELPRASRYLLPFAQPPPESG